MTYNEEFWTKVEGFAKDSLKDQDITHNFTHVERVLESLEKMCRGRDVDWNLMRLVCLLHDAGYGRDAKNHVEASYEVVKEFLSEIGFEETEKVADIIRKHGGTWTSVPRSLEVKLFWVADKLDWVGPYGLFRVLIQNANMNSFKEIIDFYLETVKKIEIDKVDDEKLKSELLENWESTQKLLEKMKLVEK